MSNREEIQRLEQKIQENEERYRVFIATSFTAVAIQQEGLIVFINDEAARILKAVSPEDLVGKSVLDYEWRTVLQEPQ